MIEFGNRARAIKFPSDSGEALSLAHLKGAPLVRFFWPKNDMSGCTKEAIVSTEHADAYEPVNVRILGVSPDSVASHQKFREKHDLGTTLLADEEHKMAED